MNTPVKPAAGQAGPDADDVDLNAGVPLATRAMSGDAEAANRLAFMPRILPDWLKRELTQDGMTDEERARYEEEEKREREDALVRMLESDRAQNNAMIADLRAKDADLCKQMEDMDKKAIVMPDGRLAYKDKYGNFVYLDGTTVDDQEYARKKDAANGGKTQGWEERRAAEDTHIKYNKEIDQAIERNAEIDRIEQKLNSNTLDESERAALIVHENTVKAEIAKETVLDGTKKDDPTRAAIAAATTDTSDDQITSFKKHKPVTQSSVSEQPLVQGDQKMASGNQIYLNNKGEFVHVDGTSVESGNVAERVKTDEATNALASVSRTSYSGGLETAGNLSSKEAFTLASNGVTPAATPDSPAPSGNSLQKNLISPGTPVSA